MNHEKWITITCDRTGLQPAADADRYAPKKTMRKYILLYLILTGTIAQAENPDVSGDYIVEGACPFECCVYREWGVTSDTQLFSEKDVNSGKVVVVKSGSKIQALTGDVHVRPQKLTVTNDFETHRAGETIWLLDYLGEGIYRVWKNGELSSLDLPFSPYGNIKPLEWATIEGQYKMDWWVKFETRSGDIGWSSQIKNFSNMDGCG